MKQGGLGRLVLVLLACGAASAARAQVQVFTDEGAYLAALAAAGRGAFSEGFEGAPWEGVRSTIAGGTSTAPSVKSQGITWTASAGVTTNDLGPRSGTWRGYDHPGGAPDRLGGTSAARLYGVGGWFTTNILPSSLRVFVGGVSPDNATLALSTGYQFLGVVDPAGFTAFELVGDGAPGDEKHWFADDFTFGVAAGTTTNRAPHGTIVLPAAGVTAGAGSAVTFAGQVSDPDGDAVTVVWDFGDGTSSDLVSPGGHTFETPGVYTVTFTATDALGLADPDPDARTVTVVDATPAVDGLVPGVADVRGLQGSDWHTDLWVHNSGATEVTVTLRYAAKGEAPGLAHALDVTVAAGRTLRLADVVATGFGLSGTSGTVLYEVAGGDAAAVLVRGDTYNRLNPRERYGQSLPGIPVADAAPAGRPVFLPGLQDAVQYRYNLGVQSAGARRARVRVLEGATGAVLHDGEVAVPPFGWTQLVDLERSLQLGAASGWYLEVTGLDGAVAASGNLIDQRSNDSINIAGRALRTAAAGLWLPGAASTSGYLGSRWRSDLFTVNPGPAAGRSELAFFPRDSASGSAVAPVTLAVAAGRQLVVEDLVGLTFGLPDGSAGAVSLRQGEASELLHLLRTYNETVDAEGQRSTYGSATPAVGEDELLGAGEEGRIVGVVDDADTRANLTLLNARTDAAGAGQSSEVEIELLAGDGSRLFRDSVVLLPFQNVQINRFPERYLGSGIAFADATLVVRPLGFSAADAGGVLAAVSVVNGNRTPGVGTSDPQVVVAVKRPAQGAAPPAPGAGGR